MRPAGGHTHGDHRDHLAESERGVILRQLGLLPLGPSRGPRWGQECNIQSVLNPSTQKKHTEEAQCNLMKKKGRWEQTQKGPEKKRLT